MIDWLKRADIAGATEPEIELNGELVPIVLRRHRTAKRLTLRMAPDASEVRITLPRWAKAAEAIAFAHARVEWLTSQHAKIPRRAALEPGATFMIRGEPVKLAWHEKAPRRPAHDDGEVRIGGPITGVEARLRRWLEREALSLFDADTREYCSAARLAPVPVALSRAQKRWGSCSDRQRIRLNWRLIQAPDFVRRSVVAHEVTHLVHFDHSPAFHSLLGELYEGDISQADRWLKEHGRTLYTHFG